VKDWLDRLSSGFWLVRSPATPAAIVASVVGWVVLPMVGHPVGLLRLIAIGLIARVVGGVAGFGARRRRALAKAEQQAPGLGTTLWAWWGQGYRKDYTRSQTRETFEVNGFVNKRKKAPALNKLDGNLDNDLTALVSFGPMVTKGRDPYDKLAELLPALKHNIGCKEVTAKPTGSGHAILRFLWSDPLGRILPVAEMPKGGPGELVFGIWEDGTPAAIEMGMHTLIGGMTKMGKSSFLWSLLADLIRKGRKAQVHVIDPKGGSEFFDVEPHVGIWHNGLLIASYVAAAEDDDVVPALNAVVSDLKERQAANHAEGIRKWTPEMSDAEPLTILLIDECLEVFETWTNHKGPRDTVKGIPMTKFTKVLLSQGRAAGFMVIGLTQTGEVNALGSGVRRMFPNRFALGTDNAQGTDMILGDGATANGARCHEIRTPGVGYAQQEGERGFRKFRAAFCTDADRARIAAGELPDGMPADDSEAPQRYYNYSFYTADRQPLRTGITNRFDRRYDEYRRDYEKERAAIEAGRLDPAKALHQWWPYHDPAQIKITDADGFAHAKRIESEIIADGVWRYNHQENMNNPLRNVPPPEVYQDRQKRTKASNRWHRPVKSEPQVEVETQDNVSPINRRDIRRELNRRSA
jgi:hypothetical protein